MRKIKGLATGCCCRAKAPGDRARSYRPTDSQQKTPGPSVGGLTVRQALASGPLSNLYPGPGHITWLLVGWEILFRDTRQLLLRPPGFILSCLFQGHVPTMGLKPLRQGAERFPQCPRSLHVHSHLLELPVHCDLGTRQPHNWEPREMGWEGTALDALRQGGSINDQSETLIWSISSSVSPPKTPWPEPPAWCKSSCHAPIPSLALPGAE